MWLVVWTDSNNDKHRSWVHTREVAMEMVRTLESKGNEPVSCWFDTTVIHATGERVVCQNTWKPVK